MARLSSSTCSMYVHRPSRHPFCACLSASTTKDLLLIRARVSVVAGIADHRLLVCGCEFAAGVIPKEAIKRRLDLLFY